MDTQTVTLSELKSADDFMLDVLKAGYEMKVSAEGIAEIKYEESTKEKLEALIEEHK